ncbi:MAG: SRPBCC family protein [candidate division NC10 bacterium]|nr:SRPBCC family protein [candidate division NC10 bacterium]
MALKIAEKFQVQAPVARVWQYLMDPHQVVVCMPGAELVEIVDERTFLGNVKVRVGPVTVSFKGRIQFTEVDEPGHRIQMVGEGREAGGAGSARVTMSSRIDQLPDGSAEVTVEAEVDLVGKIVQFGRGMIEDVAKRLFHQFAGCVKAHLEQPAKAPAAGTAPAPPRKAEPVRAIPLALKALWAAIVRFFRRLIGG